MINSRKTKYIPLIFLMTCGFFQWFGALAQPTLKQVVPDYGGNRMKLVWTAVGSAQAYATRARVNSGTWSGWDSIGVVTSKFITGTFNSTDTYNYQVRVKVAGTWSAASAERGAKYKIVWPVLNTAGTAPSKNLMHNFNQPIHAGGNTYLHEGVDINGDKATSSEKVVSSHGGRVRSITAGTSNREIDIAIMINGVESFISYGHLKSVPATVQAGYSVKAGEQIGLIDNSSWNVLTRHTHWHYWSGANFLTSTLNPFTSFTNNADRDPGNNAPVVKNTNSNAKDFVFRQAKKSWKYFANNDIAYTDIDIVCEAVDQMSTNGLYQIPKSVSYFIQRKTGNTWVDAVKTNAAPYVLYDNINNNLKNFWTHDKEIIDALIDPDSSHQSQPAITPKNYVFKQWFNWVITNTKGTSGTKADFDTNQCWATNARTSVTTANGYKVNYDKSRNIEEAKFPDGEYRVGIKLTDFTHTPAATYKTIKLDNFKPYVDKITMYTGSTKFYEADWTWNGTTAQLVFSPNTISTKPACNQPIKINIIFKEAMSQAVLNIPNLNYNKVNTTPLDAAKEIFEFTISAAQLAHAKQSKSTLYISGKDICNSPVHGFQNTSNFPAASIPKRQSNGSWLPATASQPDKIHYFELDTIRVGMTAKKDVSCHGGSDGNATVTAYSGQAPYTYFWSPSGQTGQTASGLSHGNYEAYVTDKNNCSGMADTFINEPAEIQISIAGGPAIIPFCIQDGQPSVTLTASASGGTPPYNYSWPNQTLIVSGSGFYTVTVTDSNGCSAEATTFVWFISILCSRDPNDITGPSGYGERKLISNTDIVPYIIRFENDPDFASAPAQTVTVTCPFDPHLNMYSFRLAEFGFGDFDIQIPSGKTFYTTRVDVKDSLDVYVDVIAGIDATQNEAFWIFESIDPNSGLAPIDPNKGFLLINDTVTHRGEGYASFIVKPQSNNTSGDSIKAKAKIVFDVNSAIYTNEWYNIIDAIAPSSAVDSLPPTLDSSSFVVSWSGTDDSSGSGIATYDLYVAANNQSFTLYKKDIEDTSEIFTGSYGVTYKFYTRAKDHVGNKEAAKNTADAQITIMPERFFNKPDSNSSQCLASSLNITWKEKDINYINLRYTADSGQTYHMIADGLAITNLSYNWSIPDSLSGNTYYQIAAFNAETNSLFSSSDYFIIRGFPTVDAGSNSDICLGSSLLIGGSPTAGGTSSPYYYQWTNGSSLNYDTVSNPMAQPAVNTRYNITVTDSFGCSATDSVDVVVHSVPVSGFTINDTSQCLNNNSFILIDKTTISADNFSISWSLGDSNTSTQDTVTHSYAAAGDYIIKLTATSNYGCADSVQQTIHVNPMPVSAFTVNDTDQCLSTNSFTMNNTSTLSSGSSSYLWTASNGDTSTLNSPVFSFNSYGSYSMKLLSTSDQGCQDSVLQQLIVFASPSAAFSVNDSSQCLNTNEFTFTNSSSIGSGSFSNIWTFGDNDTSTASSPVKSYATDDTFTVKLVVTSDKNCLDSISANMYVFPVPNVSFTVNDTDQCLYDNSFSFTNTSTISSGSINSYWTFGNDSSSSLTNPATSYISEGNYPVKLHMTSGEGCIDSANQNVYLRPMPVAGFGIQSGMQCLSGNSFIFSDSSTITSGTLSFMWDFGDNDTSSTQNPTHSYSSSDTFNVKLLVTSAFGCKDSTNKNVITNPMPFAGFTVSDTALCLQNNQFTFYNSSTINSGNMSFDWDFGDNSTSTLENPTKSYSAEGTYAVKLLVTSSLGCTDSFIRNINVYTMPGATFSVNDSVQCLNSNAYIFTNNSTINSGSLTYLWEFGNGDTSTAMNPTYSYQSDDSFTVFLHVYSDKGCTDSTSLNLYIHPNPLAAFGINKPDQCLRNNLYLFSDSSTISSGTISYHWDFGDLDNSSQQNPSHTYLLEGIYQVSLIAESGLGCLDTALKQVNILADPVSSFSVSDTAACLASNSFTFTNQSSITQGTLNYYWDFGNGDTSTSANPSVTYGSADTFAVSLIAYSSLGCQDTSFLDLIVHPSPVSDFVINKDTQCFSLNYFVYSNNSFISTGIMSHHWDFGDSNTSNLTSASHSYLVADSYTIKLVSTSSLGCRDSLEKQILIHPSPVSDFSMNDSIQCQNTNYFEFYNNSTISAGTLTYLWLFGDGNQSIIDSPSHVYLLDSTFVVTLVSASNKACLDTVSKNIHTLASPLADFMVNDSIQCLNNNLFEFTNLSVIDTGTLFYYWAFVSDTDTSSVNFSNQEDPDHIYLNTGHYAVKLKAVSSSQCMDSVYKNVYVKANPFVHFTVYDACLGDSSRFYDYSVVDSPATLGTWRWYFGDGDSSYAQNPVHLYDTAGAYNITLIVGSSESCSDSASVQSQVFELPEPGFTTTFGTNGRATFKPVADSMGHFYSWYFGDGDSSSEYSPTHKYGSNNDYFVELIVMNSNGCKISTIDTISISNVLSEKELQAHKFRLEVYPNPFTTLTQISFDLNTGAKIKLVVYDVAGKKVETLAEASMRAGRYLYYFGGQNPLPAGVYFIRLYVNDKVFVERVVKVLLPY
ncbi:MAG: PKD domain-containing protein [Bacteroidetes bacterium]|nr:PKD domain-containing protein [Bacteroidota bacterium]